MSHRILVLGGGYAGMMAAIRTAGRTRRRGGRVTLVNPAPTFTERLRLHQVAAGQRLVEHRIEDVLRGTGVEFVQGAAESIDPGSHTVTVSAPPAAGDAEAGTRAGERVLAYDTLVFAIGSVSDGAAVPGVAEHAFTLDGAPAAARLATRLAELAAVAGDAGRAGLERPTVAVCGGGLTGVEAATEIAESHPGLRVVLLSARPCGGMMGRGARAYLNGALKRLKVEVRGEARIAKVLPQAVELEDGEVIGADAVLWTAGVRVPPLAARAGIETDRLGRVVTDPTLRSVSHPAVYAVGDAAAVRQPYGIMHGTCQGGVPAAVHVADQIRRDLRGGARRPFRFGYLHQPVSLGRRDAVIQFTRADDSPARWYLKGRAAVTYKNLVSSSPLPLYRLSRRLTLPSSLLWRRA